MSGKCRFNHAWLQMEKYMSWVKTDENPGRAKCRLCGGKTFDISNTGEAALPINEPCQRKQTEHCSILLRKPENSCIFCYSVNKQLQLENKRKITITSLFCLKGHTLFVNMISNMYY